MENRRTSQGSAITKVVRDATGPLRPLEILELASRIVPTLGIATVYRQLRRLQDAGQVRAVDLASMMCATSRPTAVIITIFSVVSARKHLISMGARRVYQKWCRPVLWSKRMKSRFMDNAKNVAMLPRGSETGLACIGEMKHKIVF